MMPLLVLQKAFLYGVLFLSTVAALGVVLFRNIFHSALCLVATLVGVAILYLALEAEFIAVVQILLYVGAVMTVVIFAIMLTHRLGDQTIPQSNRQSLPAFLALLVFAVVAGLRLLKTDWPVSEIAGRVDTLALGQALLGPYVFPFEVVSIVLIAGLIGAVVIARKE
jgi:NADH-quinone oxidoreductase subunit J